MDAGISQAEGQLERAFASLLDCEDAQAAPLFQAVLRSKGSGGPSGAPQRLAASYGAGVAAYNLGRHADPASDDMAGLQAAPMEDVLDAMGRVLAARGMADRFRPTLDGISLAATRSTPRRRRSPPTSR